MNETNGRVTPVEGERRTHPSLAAALVGAQADARPVAKGGWNDYSRYPYATAESMLDETRRIMSLNGLAFVCTGWSLVRAADGVTSLDFPRDKNEEATVAEAPPMVEAYFRLVHESGQEMELRPVPMPLIEERGRPMDKALATALTYLESYVSRGVLCLSKHDDKTDVDSRDDTQRDVRSRAPAKAAPRKAAPRKAGAPLNGDWPKVVSTRKGDKDDAKHVDWSKCETCGEEFPAGAGVAVKRNESDKWHAFCAADWKEMQVAEVALADEHEPGSRG
jgi:ERF superfamily protein